MLSFQKTFSEKRAEDAIINCLVPAGDGFMHPLCKGESLRIVDLEGNQGLDFLCYNLHNIEDHYSAAQTIVRQKKLYINAGTVLVTESGRELLKMTADTCTAHDTIGGACATESNTVRYGHHTLHMRTCRDVFIEQIAQQIFDSYGKAELVPNVNLFAQILKLPDGRFEFMDGISAPGSYVEFEAINDTMILISNCPQINNPCSGFAPTTNQILIWEKES
ncbi:urea carboxylase [Clostridia bacterium]|nr:urea carboxylase [Clostridia bacterium]